jgi:hypothetical protein
MASADAVSDAVEYFLGQGVLRMELHGATITQNDPALFIYRIVVITIFRNPHANASAQIRMKIDESIFRGKGGSLSELPNA